MHPAGGRSGSIVGAAETAADGSVLPFEPPPSASAAGYTLAESTHHPREAPDHLAADAPNIVMVLLDDVGFELSDVVGGEVHTPTFGRVAQNSICYNTFHTTSICSPTRAALLTGRNHHRVHSGTTERAVDWDGYTGVIGKTLVERQQVVRDLTKVEPIVRAHSTQKIDTNRPIVTVVDTLIRIAYERPPARVCV